MKRNLISSLVKCILTTIRQNDANPIIMKFIAEEKEITISNKRLIDKYFDRELIQICELMLQNIILDILYDVGKNVHYVVECENLRAAQSIFDDLPMVKRGYKKFEILSLQ